MSESAKADDTVKPAPPVESVLPSEEEDFEAPPAKGFNERKAGGNGVPQIILPDELKEHLSIELEEILDDEPLPGHDEL